MDITVVDVLHSCMVGVNKVGHSGQLPLKTESQGLTFVSVRENQIFPDSRLK